METVNQPYNLDIQLYPHQLSSIYMMEELERYKYLEKDDVKIYTNIGVNSDITGYGKTMSMVGLILRDKMEWGISSQYVEEKIDILITDKFSKKSLSYYRKVNTTLILVNKSLVLHWLKEFSHTNLKVFALTKKCMVESLNIEEYDVIIVIPSIYNYLMNSKCKGQIAWKRFIFDEPSSIRVPAMREITAGFIWFVTSTPEEIYNNHKKCKSYMKTITYRFKDMLPYINVKNEDNFVISSYMMPKTNHIYHNCHSTIYKLVNGLIDEKIIKIIESGNIDTAIELLGGSSVSSNSIFDIVKHNKNIELEEVKSKIKIWELRRNQDKVNKWKQREQLILNHINELEKRFNNILISNCPICYDELKNPVLEPGCHNVFCSQCLLYWICNKNNCPLCRKDIQPDKLVYIKKDTEQEEKKNVNKRLKTKEETIIEIIRDKKDGKFILFSDYLESFYAIRVILNENDIHFVEIKGSISNIENNLEKYKNGDVNVVFLNSKTDNAGLNLENTTDIILYHSLDENTTKQVIGRGNRIGRKTQLNVHYLNL
jgi:hypothetical protein